jgi:predicted dehydrogenase
MSTPLKIGMVGLDSSHCVEYAKLLHDEAHPQHVPGARVVAAYPGGSDDWELSRSRVAGFTEQMERDHGVSIVSSIGEVAVRVDAGMILSVDARAHRQEFAEVAVSGKPVYIDKPLALSPEEMDAFNALGAQTGSRFFSSSVWRFSEGFRQAQEAVGGTCRHAHLHGPWPCYEGMHGWAYYGIHHVELLFHLMGPDCERVACQRDEATTVITGYWPDGRLGTLAANHGQEVQFGGWLVGEQGGAGVEVRESKYHRYQRFLQSALTFFKGAPAPVDPTETRATLDFLTAAAKSAQAGGTIVTLSSHAA